MADLYAYQYASCDALDWGFGLKMPCMPGLVSYWYLFDLLHMTCDIAVGLDHFAPCPPAPMIVQDCLELLPQVLKEKR